MYKQLEDESPFKLARDKMTKPADITVYGGDSAHKERKASLNEEEDGESSLA